MNVAEGEKKKKSVLRARLISRVDAERAKISFAHVECLSKIFFFPVTSYEWPELKRLSSLPASLKSLCLGGSFIIFCHIAHTCLAHSQCKENSLPEFLNLYSDAFEVIAK